MTDNYKELLNVASNTKQALIDRWNKESGFIDNNALAKKGLLPEGIGLTGLLLLAIAFRDEKDVITDEDRAAISEIAGASLMQIMEWVKAEGFSAAPLYRRNDLFDEANGYTETVTWCLSASILTRYAQKTGTIAISDETHDCVLELMAKSIRLLLDAQRPDGTWGFRTDTGASRSLYFTYSANSAIADFFDYILGEIESVEEENDYDTDGTISVVDTETIQYLNEKLGCDVEQKMIEARASLQKWLIEFALPLMPLVSSCLELSSRKLELLGMWKHDSVTIGGQERYFYHLYYTYYLIDMMVTAAVDLRFDEMLKDKAALTALKKHYTENRLLSTADLKYFFGTGAEVDPAHCNISKLHSMCVEQAIHSSRMQYIAASKTGADFWDSADSEMPISWLHENMGVGDTAKIATSKLRGKLTDPCIAPMSLRANAVYCYYVTEKPDMTVERLYSDICGDAYKEEEYNDDCVLDLWDRICFSLPITERAIESIVDFYDYLRKFEISADTETQKENAHPAGPETAAGEGGRKSQFELAVEQKLSEYLQSEQGRAIIAAAAGNTAAAAPAAAAPAAADRKTVISEISRISEYIGNTPLTAVDEEKTEDDLLVDEMLNLFRVLQALNVRMMIDEVSSGQGMLRDSYIDHVKKNETELSRRYNELFKCLVEDLQKQEYNYRSLYTFIKQSFGKSD